MTFYGRHTAQHPGAMVRNNNKKFRFFKSKENIHKKEVGPYHGFGFLKFATNIRYDMLFCALKNQPHMAFQFLYLAIFFLSSILYIMGTSKCLTLNKIEMLRFILPFSICCFFYLLLQCYDDGNVLHRFLRKNLTYNLEIWCNFRHDE